MVITPYCSLGSGISPDVVAQGKIHEIAVLADGSVRVAMDYRSPKLAHRYIREVDALSAMIAEDAAARLDEELWGIVRDYHNGDD